MAVPWAVHGQDGGSQRPQHQSTNPSKISRRNPDTDLDIVSFYIAGDSTTRPAIEFGSYGGGINIDKEGEMWSDPYRGFTLCLEISDEPDEDQTKVLVGDTPCSDWVLEEAIRTLARGSHSDPDVDPSPTCRSQGCVDGSDTWLVDSTEICDASGKCDARP